MIIDRGDFIVLLYLLACLGAIVAFLLAVFAVGWIIGSAARTPPQATRAPRRGRRQGLVMRYYSRRQLFANAAIAASRVGS
jgi:hypothetical protein